MVVKVSSEDMPLGWPNAVHNNLACNDNPNFNSTPQQFILQK
jgi:hypothetical protein